MSGLGVLVNHHICVLLPITRQRGLFCLLVCRGTPFLLWCGCLLSPYPSWHAPSSPAQLCPFGWCVILAGHFPQKSLDKNLKIGLSLSPPLNHALLPLTHDLIVLCIGWWDLGLACAFLSCMSNLLAAFSSVVVWRLVCIACRSFFDLLCELLFDFPLPLGLIFIYRCALYSLRPISWLPSFPVILLCHFCHNDSILLGLFGLALLGPLVFLLMGSCVPFALFSLGHPWPVLLPLGFLIPFTNSAFPWAITNFIGLPWPNYFILILGVHRLAINPLLSLFTLLLGLQWPILTFSTSYTAHGYAISLFPSFFKPIYLLKAHLFILWTYDPSFLPLEPDGLATCLPNLCCPCCWAFCLLVGSLKMTLNNDQNTPET